MTLRRGRAGGGGLSQPSALGNVFQGRERGNAVDCRILCGVVEKWADPTGRLLRHDERSDDRTRQAARGQTGWGRRNLAVVDGKMLASGDMEGGQGRLQDRTAGHWRGGGDRGQYTQHETDVETSLLGRGPGITPH